MVTGIGLNEIKNVIFNPECNDYDYEIHRIVLGVSCLYGQSSICGIDCEISKLSPVIRVFLEKFGDIEYIPIEEMDAGKDKKLKLKLDFSLWALIFFFT